MGTKVFFIVTNRGIQNVIIYETSQTTEINFYYAVLCQETPFFCTFCIATILYRPCQLHFVPFWVRNVINIGIHKGLCPLCRGCRGTESPCIMPHK